jgi:heme-degrading monooxygenase HmoA
LFKFPQDLTPDEEKEMYEQVRAWPRTIDGFTGLRLGRDVSGRSGGWMYLLLTEFESEEAHQAYYSQPAHVAFSKWVVAREAEVARIDYALTGENLIL